MRYVSAAAVAAALMIGAGTAQAARYCDPYRPFVCVDQPDPPSVTYTYPPQTTYRIEPAPPPPQVTYQYQAPPPPPQVTYQYQGPPVIQYQGPPAVTVRPQPAYPPQGTISVEVK